MHLTKNTFLKTINNRILLFLLSILVCYFSIISIEYFDFKYDRSSESFSIYICILFLIIYPTYNYN